MFHSPTVIWLILAILVPLGLCARGRPPKPIILDFKEVPSVIVGNQLHTRIDSQQKYRNDMARWLRGSAIFVGNSSQNDLRWIQNSIFEMTRLESVKFPRVHIHNYKGANANTREVLVFTDPDERRQWVVNIDELDLRNHLIVFRLGDQGFGFAKENTFVVLRQSMQPSPEPFHYIHLAYIRERGDSIIKDVEWDNLKPLDLLPLPLFYDGEIKEPNHCRTRNCDIVDHIFGTCPIVKLNCSQVDKLPLKGRDLERVEALLHERQPFIYELARSLSTNKQYLKEESNSTEETVSHVARKKRSAHILEAEHPQFGPPENARFTLNQAVPALSATQDKAMGTADKVKREENEEEATKETVPDPTKDSDDDDGDPEATEANLRSSNPMKLVLLKDEKSAAAANLDTASAAVKNALTDHNETESYFESVLAKIQNGPPAKYSIRPFDCTGCAPLGTYFSDYQENPLVTFVANKIVANLFPDEGSRAPVFSSIATTVLDDNPSIPFIGYGYCDFSPEELMKPPKSTELDDMIDFYSETLSFNCEPYDEQDCESHEVRIRLRELLTSKYHFLEVWPDMTIRFNKSNKITKNLIMSSNEFRQFMISLTLSTYTIEYRYQMRSRAAEGVDALNNNTSKMMKFQSRVIFRLLDELIKNFPQHLIKGCRFILQTLQDKYLTLVAENLRISEYEFNEGERDRAEFKDMNKHDRIQVIALSDFIINGIGPTSRSGNKSITAFHTFFSQNRKRIFHLLVELGARLNTKRSTQRRNAELAEVEELFHRLSESSRLLENLRDEA